MTFPTLILLEVQNKLTRIAPLKRNANTGCLVGPSLKTLRNVADIVGRSAPPVTEVVGIDVSGVVLPQGRIDGALGHRVAPVSKVALVVINATTNHVVDLLL